ncbi:MAG: integration host factor subunit alpha [Polynucleobacter sp.]|nr:integration host factor subunit alpha [Polynucleobacter sp.]MCW1965026.1 integration host factor subunit alpha [Polynucleobacter sp.]
MPRKNLKKSISKRLFMSEMITNDTVTKNELSEALFDQVGLNKREAKDMIDAFFDRIGQSLEAGTEVKISGFGNFQLRNKSARPGRNPKTGQLIPIAARRVVTFHASQKLKDVVESHARENRV